jgi:hypothetical protein
LVTIDFSAFFRGKEFNVQDGDFSTLEIRDSGKAGGLHYFYDTVAGRLVTDFLIWKGPRVSTLVHVTLIKKGEFFEPRLRLWKRNNRGAQGATDEAIPDTPATRDVRASVDTDDGHEHFWKLVAFLRSFSGVKLPAEGFRVVGEDQAELVRLLSGKDKETVLSAVRSALGGTLTESDISMLSNRKAQLEVFRRLLEDETFFDERKTASQIRGDEAVWQDFFEANQWIFGYGLTLVACEALDDKKLERYTSGANIFTGAGKRSDAVMKTKGFIKSLLFAEIKTHKTDLLEKSPYRPPDVYRVSDELIGAVSQVQKTADKAVRALGDRIAKLYAADGSPTGIEFATVRPRQVLVIGQLREFDVNGNVNPEMVHSFELFRRSVNDVEVLTFDELYERARYIVG